MNHAILKNRKIGLLAIIGPAYALISIAVAIMLSPWFSWRNNAISDLGVSDVAPIFNISLIVCGILCAIFFLSMILYLKDWLGKVGMFLMLLASIALVGIGVFTEDYSPHHSYFSLAFFTLLLVASILLCGFFLVKRSTRYLGVTALAVVIIGFGGWVELDWGPGIAIPEALTFVPGSIFIMMLGEWFYRTDQKR